jgi:predicted MFS family arabinose efflux permease
VNGRAASLWRHGGFLKLWAAQGVSGFGARIAREGLPMTAVMVLKAPPQAMGALAAAGLVAYAAGGVVAGVLADRLPRRPLLIGADLGRAAIMLVLPALALWSRLTLVEVGVALAAMSALTVVFDVADHAWLPSVIEAGQLLDGNAKLAATDSVAEVGGPAIAGVLFQWLSAPIAVAASAATYLASALFLLGIRQHPAPASGEPAHEEPAPPPASFHPLAGFRIVLRHPSVRPIWLMALGNDFFGWFFGALYILYALDVLKLSTTELGLTIAAGGIGGLLGAFLAPAFTRRLGPGRALVVSTFLTAVTLLPIPLAPDLGAHGSPLLAMTFLIAAQLTGDAMHTVMQIGQTSLRQTLLPNQELGRAAGAFATGQGLAGFAGALIGGALGAWIGPRETLLLAVVGRAASPLIGLASPLWRRAPGAAA